MAERKYTSLEILENVMEIMEMRRGNPDILISEVELAHPVFCIKFPSLVEKVLNEENFDVEMLKKMLGVRDKITPQNYMDANFQVHQNLYKQYVQPNLSEDKLEIMIEQILKELVPVIEYISQRGPQWDRVNAPQKLVDSLEERFKGLMEKYKFIIAYILEKNVLNYDDIRDYLKTFYMNDKEIKLV
jgi:hypothetical protein